MPKHLKLENCPALEAATDAMDGMEPELRQLAGLLVALRVLGEADDAIEPVAISSLAKSAGSTLDDIEELWRTAIGLSAVHKNVCRDRRFPLDFTDAASIAVCH